MSLEIFRICNGKYEDDLSGTGAKLYGGRWNSKGVPVNYFSSSKSLAVLELLVHSNINLLPDNLKIITLFVPSEIKIKTFNITELPENWKTYPAPIQNQILGDEWLNSNKNLILKLPSVIIPTEYNYLINPNHKDIEKVKIIQKENFRFDERLVNN